MSSYTRSRGLLLGLVIVAAFVGVSIVVTGSATAQQVDVDPTNLEGSGSQADPYIITNASELQAIEDNTYANYKLGTDINVTNTTSWNNGKGFDPIGDDVFDSPNIPAFGGSLDGNNHTVTGLTINRDNKTNVGLIGFADSDATIRDLRLKNTTVTGESNVGGIVGKNDGQIQNTIAVGSVAGDNGVGGIVGKNDGQIKDSKAAGSVNSRVGAGGLVGHNDETIQNATVVVSVSGSRGVGGLAGFNGGTIQNTISRGSVNGSEKVGGLVGTNGYDDQIQYSIAVGKVTGSEDVGGIVGVSSGLNNKQIYWDTEATGQSNSDGDATGLTTAEMTGKAAQTNMPGLSFGTVWETQSDDYPVLRSQTSDGDSGDDGGNASDSGFVDIDPSDLAGVGTESDPYVITNVSGLQTMENDLDAHYMLASDINASVTADWNSGNGFDPIGNGSYGSRQPFNGSLAGENHIIKNLTIYRPSSTSDELTPIGLFGAVGKSGTVSNISITDANITGGYITGVVAGQNDGKVINVRADGDVITTYEGEYLIGGLIGDNSGVLTESRAAVTVTTTVNTSINAGGGLAGTNTGSITDSYTTGSVIIRGDAGGLVGQNFNNITRSYATGSIEGTRAGGLVGANFNGGSINASYATGSVDGVTTDSIAGGLVGKNYDSIANSYATSTVAADQVAGGLVGVSQKAIIRDSYATGEVGGNDTGGFVGAIETNSTIIESYWDTETTGQATSAGNATGLLTREMSGQAAQTNMSALAFGTIWKTRSDDYPTLAWQTREDDSNNDHSGSDDNGSSEINATATLTGENATVSPGENATIEYTVTNTGDVDSGYILNLSLPEELTAVSYTNASGERQGNESKWLWQTITPGETVTPTVTVQLPADSTGTYTIDAAVFTDEGIVAQNETTVTAGTVSIPEAIDTNDNNEIDDQEILAAIEYWQTGESVPGTDGERIGDFEILDLIEQWRYNSKI